MSTKILKFYYLKPYVRRWSYSSSTAVGTRIIVDVDVSVCGYLSVTYIDNSSNKLNSSYN